MPMHILDDEQRCDRRATRMRPLVPARWASAALALLDDMHRHRLRRAALHLPPPGQERGPSDQTRAKTTNPFAGMTMFADAPNPCIGGPDATMPPPLPATDGLTQFS